MTETLEQPDIVNNGQAVSAPVVTDCVTSPPQNPSQTPPVMVPGKNGGKLKRGGQPGNNNRTRHGRTAWTDAGRMPRRYRPEREAVLKMSREIEAQLVAAAAGKPLTVYQKSLLGTFVRHEGRCRLLERWLGDKCDTMTLAERLDITSQICAASDSRDACLKKLGLADATGTNNELDPAALYAALRTQQAAERAAPPPSAPKSATTPSSPADGPSEPQEARQPTARPPET